MEPTSPFTPTPQNSPDQNDKISSAPENPQPANSPQNLSGQDTFVPTATPVQPSTVWDKTSQPTVSPDPNISPSLEPVVGASQGQPNSQQQNKGKNGKKIAIVIVGVLAGLFLLGGGIAAAYLGVVVPNKPENVLRQALINTSKEKEISVEGVYNAKAVDASKENAEPATKVIYSGKTNADKKQGEVTLKVTMSGIDFPIEARYIDGNAYVKVGDLKTIMSLISGYAGTALGFNPAELDPLIANVSQLVSNQWIEFDSTLLDTAGVGCAADANFALTDQDIKLLEDQFTKNPFVKIDSHAKDKVNGAAAIKYQISVDDNKAAKFLEDKKLQELSFIKTLKKCAGDNWSDSPSMKSLADGDITPITIWVDKGTKRISKIASHSTKQDAEKENLEANLEATIKYNKVSVTKPENTKPAMQIWGQLTQEFSKVFGGFTETVPFTDDSMTNIDYPYNSVPQ